MTKKNFTQSIDNFIEKALYDKKLDIILKKILLVKKATL